MKELDYYSTKLENEVGFKKIKRLISDNNLYYSQITNRYKNLIEVSRRINDLNYKNNLKKIGIYSSNYTLKNDLTPEEPWFNIPIDVYRKLNNLTLYYIIVSVVADDYVQYYLLPVGLKLNNFLIKYTDLIKKRYVFTISSLEKVIGNTIEGYKINEEQLYYFIESFKNII